MVPFAQVYYYTGRMEQGDSVVNILKNRYTEDINYYMTLQDKHLSFYEEDLSIAFSTIQRLSMLAGEFGRDDLKTELEGIIDEKISYF